MKQVILGGRPASGSAASPKHKKKQKAPKRRRRTGRQTLNYLLLLIVAAAIMLVLSMTVLFRVGEITTNGVTKYAPQALKEACGVKEGDNLLRINERVVRKRIKDKFPYVENLTLGREFPDVLVLEVTEAKILGACETESGYVVVGETGRILETGLQEMPADACLIYGMYIADPKVGHILGKGFDKEQQEEQKKEEQAFATLSELMAAISETQFENVTFLDLTDTLNTAIVYDDRVMIELGSVADLSYKLQFVSYVLQSQLPQGFEGVVDASYCTTSKSVVTSAKDVQLELELRRARLGYETKSEQAADDTSSESADDSKNSDSSKSESKDDKDQKNSSSSSSTGSSSSEPEKEEVRVGPYSADELAVLPGEDPEPEESSSSEASSSGESDEKNS